MSDLNVVGLMEKCTLCPRECKAERSKGKKGFCRETDEVILARAALHLWEEPCISGTNGSGAVFFSGCNLRCVFCQNHSISGGETGKKVDISRLGEIFLDLQTKGAHNINLVTASHYVPQVVEALKNAKKSGLRIPVVFNCGGYEKPEILELLRDYVDIWLPDFKYKSEQLSAKYSAAADYFDVASAALDKMVSILDEKGNGKICDFGEDGMMKRGIIVRHMVLPGCTADSKRILRYLHERYGDKIYISIMSQYTPLPHVKAYPELDRRITPEEYERVVDFARRIGIVNGFTQDLETAKESFIPEFDCEGV